jgi:hypothetical protein
MSHGVKKSAERAAENVSEATPKTITTTIPLSVPVLTDDGKLISDVRLVEPELRHLQQVQRQTTATESEEAVLYIAALSDLDPAIVRRMKVRDARALKKWIDDVATSGVRADIAAEMEKAKENPTADGALESIRTFQRA